MFSISGTLTASPSQAVDWDNNDPASGGRSNDTPDQAQPVPNPITLGGYVNQPETGAEGRSYSSGDVDDYFRVELLAGQSITMLVADYQQADADLYLYDTRGNILDFSIEVRRSRNPGHSRAMAPTSSTPIALRRRHQLHPGHRQPECACQPQPAAFRYRALANQS